MSDFQDQVQCQGSPLTSDQGVLSSVNSLSSSLASRLISSVPETKTSARSAAGWSARQLSEERSRCSRSPTRQSPRQLQS